MWLDQWHGMANAGRGQAKKADKIAYLQLWQNTWGREEVDLVVVWWRIRTKVSLGFNKWIGAFTLPHLFERKMMSNSTQPYSWECRIDFLVDDVEGVYNTDDKQAKLNYVAKNIHIWHRVKFLQRKKWLTNGFYYKDFRNVESCAQILLKKYQITNLCKL